jgi:hypothetical protein
LQFYDRLKDRKDEKVKKREDQRDSRRKKEEERKRRLEEVGMIFFPVEKDIECRAKERGKIVEMRFDWLIDCPMKLKYGTTR